MANDNFLRDELVFILTKGNAHKTFEEIVADFPEDHYNTVFPNGRYSFWFVLEHIRRIQADILDFVTNENYKEPVFPDDYWPKQGEVATKKEWEKTISDFLADRDTLEKMIKDPETDIYKKVPWGHGQTFAREILVIADHTSYELGEFAVMRQVLADWANKYH